MSPALQRILARGAASLATLVCFCCLPVTRLTALLVPSGSREAMDGERGHPPPQSVIDFHLDNLPVSHRHQPVVLVCGDQAEHGLSDDPVRSVAAGTWIRVERHQDVARIGQAVLQRCPDWGNQMAVMINICPQQHHDPALLAQYLRAWRRQIGRLRKETGYALPLILGGQVGSAIVRTPLWYSDTLREGRRVWHPSIGGPAMSAWVTSGEKMTVSSMVLMDSLIRWLHQHVVQVLMESDPETPPLPPNLLLSGLGSRLDNVKKASLWSGWLQARTSLHAVAGWEPVSGGVSGSSLQPDFILPLLSVGRKETSQGLVGRSALWLLLLIALCNNAWNNGQHEHRRRNIQHSVHVPRRKNRADHLRTGHSARG